MCLMRKGAWLGGLAIGVLAAILLAAGCDKGRTRQEAPVGKSPLRKIIESLRSTDPNARQDAVARLKGIASKGLSAEEGRQALEAAADDWAADEKTDPSDDLVAAALGHPHPGYIDLVSNGFPRFSKMARWRGIGFLVETCDEAAAQAYLDLIERHAGTDFVPPAPIEGFSRSREATRRLLPALFKHAGANELGYQIHLLVLRAAEHGLITPTDLAPLAGPVLRTYAPMRNRMRDMERAEDDDWIWADDYSDPRAHSTLLLDLMGYLPGEGTIPALEEATTSRDPRVRHFAVLSLIRHGRDVPAQTVESVASSSEMRNWLHKGLASMKRLDLFPGRFASQESLAESDMVGWLTFPTELGRTPHEMELMATFDDDHGEQRYYLFRFRTRAPHWAAKDGWRAGLSGPFEIAAIPTTDAGGSTFSTFTKWDDKTPRQHFEAISGLISKHWKQRAAEIEGKQGE